MPSYLKQMLLLPGALLALSVSHVLGSNIEARDSGIAPVQFQPDENWDGIDGAWSSFTIRIGSPAQYVRTFVSWTSYQTWAVIPAGCNTTANYGACSDSRGAIFNEAKSSSWDQIGIYEFSIEGNLGYQGNAIYGYDTVGLGAPGDEGPTLSHTIVGGMAYPDFWFGIFGINPKPTNFTSFNDPSTSYMTLLKEHNYIPSVSFGYTAGAQYRFTGELASLTLGGYDASLFIENDVTWIFAADNSRDIVVAIQSISTTSSSAKLLPKPIFSYMDSTVAEIWLPLAACEAFEKEFGLVYDEKTDLYLVSGSLHQQLLKENPSITFTLGIGLNGGKTAEIKLPYAAFDLTAKPPYQGLTDNSLYFPLRRAANESQYTIGRTFFQEAYIRIDYETQTFNVSQRSWDRTAAPQIIAIASNPDGSTYPGVDFSSGGLSSGALAGIIVGIVILIAAIAAAAFIIFRLRRRLKKQAAHEKLGSDAGSTNHIATPLPTLTTRDLPPQGGDRESIYPKVELAGSMPRITMQGEDGRTYSAGDISSWHGSGASTPRSPYSHFEHSRFSAATSSGATELESPTSPGGGGYGTYSSTSSGTIGIGTMISAMQPSTVYSSRNASIAEMAANDHHAVYEMAGDLPAIREADGKQLSEKEAIVHREKLYNGTTPVASPISAHASAEEAEAHEEETGAPPPAYVSAHEVVTSSTPIDTTWAEGQSYSFQTQEGGTHGSSG